MAARIGRDMERWTRELGNIEGKGSNNWVVSGVRIGVAVCWLSLLFYTTWSLSHAAQHSAGPRRAESVEEVVAEAGAGGIV